MDFSTPKVMGILNVTPDSFYGESRKTDDNEMLTAVGKMLTEGADFIDVGGYSSRPGAAEVPVEEELRRTVGAINLIKKEFPSAVVSIDTFRSHVAKQTVEAGADVVNDISAGYMDEEMLPTVADLGVPYLAMHMKGTPSTMKEMTQYDDLIKEMMFYFSSIQDRCKKLGIRDLIIDPGFGFAKTSEQNFFLLNRLEHFQRLECPILVGVSRKSMIYRLLGLTADEALNGTTALNTLALFKGASILRVHDVKEAVEVVKLMSQLV